MYICIYTCAYCIHLFICIYIHIYRNTNAYIYISTYICIFKSTYNKLNRNYQGVFSKLETELKKKKKKKEENL